MTNAMERWGAMVDAVNGRTRFGAAGVRDPDYRCSAFEPGDPRPNGECQTDGHYMCDECIHRDTCEHGCGKRVNNCECPDSVFAEPHGSSD